MIKKAPAFQFYSSDFMIGVMYWTHDLIGKYILLLCWQHQNDVITEEHMINICKTHVKDIDNKLMSKFLQDDDGNYFNARLKDVTDNQKAYSDSRRKNREGSKSVINSKQSSLKKKNKSSKKEIRHDKDMSNTCESYVTHMEDRDEDIVLMFNSLNNTNDELKETLWSFYDMREEIEKPMTKRAVEMFTKKLKEMAADENEMIQILQNSIMNSWQGIFPLDRNNKPQTKQDVPDYMIENKKKPDQSEEKRKELLDKLRRKENEQI